MDLESNSQVTITFHYFKIKQQPHVQLTIAASAAVYFNPLNTKRSLLYLKTQFVPQSKHFSSQL